MTFLKKAIVSVLLGSAIGATTICMDTNNSIAPKYYLNIQLHSQLKDEQDRLEMLIKMAGSQVIGVCKQNVHAFLPNQKRVGEGFVEEQLRSEEWNYDFGIKERVPKAKEMHYLQLQQMQRTPEGNLNTLKKLITFAGGTCKATGAIVHVDLPDQSTIGDNFVRQTAQEVLGYQCLVQKIKKSKAHRASTQRNGNKTSCPYSSNTLYDKQRGKTEKADEYDDNIV